MNVVSPEWTQDLPTVKGFYWLWNGDDSKPEIVAVRYSPTGANAGHLVVRTTSSYAGKSSPAIETLQDQWWSGPLTPPCTEWKEQEEVRDDA